MISLIIVLGILAVIMWVTFPLIKEELGLDFAGKDRDIYDVEGWLKVGLGFVSVLMIIAALNLFSDYSYYVYLRVVTSAVMLFLAYYVLSYKPRLSLLLVALISTMVLYNPFNPFTMERAQWIFFNLAVALVLPLIARLYIAKEKALSREKTSP